MLELVKIKQERVKSHEIEKSPEPAKKTVPKIDLNVCEKNYDCIMFCPRNAISKNPKGFPAVDYSMCDGCLICLRECPTSAISEGD